MGSTLVLALETRVLPTEVVTEDAILYLEKLAKNIESLDNSRFNKVSGAWLYEDALRLKDPSKVGSYPGRKYVNQSCGHVKNLNLPEQLHLYSLLQNKTGLKLRNGSLKECFTATFGPQRSLPYRSSLYHEQTAYWVYTGELAQMERNGNGLGVGIRRVSGVSFGDLIQPHMQELNVSNQNENLVSPKESTAKQIRYVVGPLIGKSIPVECGEFDGEFRVLPSELGHGEGWATLNGWGRWDGTSFDTDGLSAIMHRWDSALGFEAKSCSPLAPQYPTVMTLWTSENPKK